jgi:hypothetical protein
VFDKWAFGIFGADLWQRWWWTRWLCGGGGWWGFYYAVVVGGWHWADNGYGRAGLLVSTLVGEGYR